ncbi:MAG: thioredoxin family protein [Planctomycetota bacterium]|nr:MAG: thioredoxin family protein [Planctomycetota bacterium]
MAATMTHPALSRFLSHRGRFAVLAVVLFAGTAMLSRSRPVPLGWGTDIEEALSQSAADHKPVLIGFYMDGCTWCEAMDEQVLSDPRVRAALSDFIPVHLSVERHREWANRFDVLGTPTYVVLDPDGRLVRRCEGYQTVSDFTAFLASAQSASDR